MNHGADADRNALPSRNGAIPYFHLCHHTLQASQSASIAPGRSSWFARGRGSATPPSSYGWFGPRRRRSHSIDQMWKAKASEEGEREERERSGPTRSRGRGRLRRGAAGWRPSPSPRPGRRPRRRPSTPIRRRRHGRAWSPCRTRTHPTRRID